MRLVQYDQEFSFGHASSHARVLSKIGRSIGRIIMYSSIE